jgi:hypothetical protein
MDDSVMNPMKTGLMFVPLGPAGGADGRFGSRGTRGVTDLDAIESQILQQAERAPEAPRRRSLHQLLEFLWRRPVREVTSA